MANTVKVTVKRQDNSKNYGVYVNGQLREGGFFNVHVARGVADRLREELTGVDPLKAWHDLCAQVNR